MNAIRSILVFAWLVISVIPIGLTLVFCSLFLKDDKLWWWFAVPWLKLTVHKPGAVRGSRDVGVIIERGQRD